MEKIIGTRGIGKTHRLMQYAVSNGATFVCSNVERYREKALKYGIIDLDIISYEDYINYIYGDIKVVINDLDEFIKTMNSKIIGFDLTID